MKRRPYLALFALVSGAALLTGYAAQGQQRPCPSVAYGLPPTVCCPPQAVCGPQQAICCPAQGVCCALACPQPVRALPTPENTKLVEELRGLLQETGSRDTFLLTVKALADVGPEAKLAVPAIIRGAERLGLSKDIEQQVKEEEGPGMLVVESIERILAGNGCTPRYAAGIVAMPPPAYAPQPPVFAVPPCPPAPWLPCPAPQSTRPTLPPETPTSSAEPIPPPSVR